MTDHSRSNCLLREADYESCEEATELLRNLGSVMPEGRNGIYRYWQRFWDDNPATRAQGRNLTRGWLLKDDGRVVGFFGNIPLLYDYGGRPVIVANASQWGVKKEYRAETPRLAEAYFQQKNSDRGCPR